jgi:mannose-6-phosphate isomerase-like protein (cupin superfamily)
MTVSGAFIVLPDQGQHLDLGNFRAEVLASSGHTSGQFTLLKTCDERPGFGPPLHRHLDAAEAFFVLRGEYLMFVEEEQHFCPVGTLVFVPRGVAHTFKVVSSESGTNLNLFTPAAMLSFFQDLSAAEADGTATPELLQEIARRSQMEVLGPVPGCYLG